MIDDSITEEQALEVAGVYVYETGQSLRANRIKAGRAAYAKSIAIDRLKTLADPTMEENERAWEIFGHAKGAGPIGMRTALAHFVASRRAPVPAPDLAEDALRAELDRQTEKDPLVSALYAAMIAVVRASDAAQKAGEK